VPKARRRGIAGTVLIHKLAGAAAAAGFKLQRVADIARRAADDLGSMGVGLGACIVPAAGVPGFELGPDEIEFGLGIHGEKGVARAKHQTADQIAAALLDAICADLGRASYLGPRALGTPDGGAVAVAIWLTALAGSVGTSS